MQYSREERGRGSIDCCPGCRGQCQRWRNMANKAVYFLVVPGFADWEAAHALAELRRHGHYDVQVVGLNRQPVPSMGGLIVQPTCSLEEIDSRHVAVFIVPGGDRW